VGNLVGAGEDTKLATIVQLDPIYIYFSPSEKDLRLILKHRQQTEIPVDVILSDGSTYPYPGQVDFIDNKADPTANTVNMRALVPNPEKSLLPGVYVTASLFLCNVPDTPLVSEKAIAEDQTGEYVYVVGEGNKVDKRTVQVGFLYDHRKIIWKGLKEGELVITEGLQMVRPGMTVRPREGHPNHHAKGASGSPNADDPGSASTTPQDTPQAATHPEAGKGTSTPAPAEK
jgi:RND family efflux transporter MFP subunit